MMMGVNGTEACMELPSEGIHRCASDYRALHVEHVGKHTEQSVANPQRRKTAMLSLIVAAVVGAATASPLQPLLGSWLFTPTNSSQLALFDDVSLDVTSSSDNDVNLAFQWNAGDGILINESWPVTLDGYDSAVPITSRVYLYNVFQGFRLPVGTNKTIAAKASASSSGTTVVLAVSYTLLSSQGNATTTDELEDLLTARVKDWG